MEFIDAMKEAMKVGISASDFKEIWMTSERRKLEEEEWKRKVEERQWMKDSLMTQEADSVTEFRTRKLSPASKENRSGAIFSRPTFLPSDDETTPKGVNQHDAAPTNLVGTNCDQLNSPPEYENHHKFKTVTGTIEDIEVEEETSVKTPEDNAEDNIEDTYEKTTQIKGVENVDDEDEDEVENLTPEQKSEMLAMIKKLTEEQKALKTRLSEHDERLNSLIKKQPSIQRRLTGSTKKRSITRSVLMKDDDGIYAQIEQLYTNFCRINLLKGTGTNSSPSWLPPLSNSNNADYPYYNGEDNNNHAVFLLMEENSRLQARISVLERESAFGYTNHPTNVGTRNLIESLKFMDLSACDSLPSAPSPIDSDVQQIETTFEWDVPHYSEKMEMEKNEKIPVTLSDCFEIGHPGYLGRLEIYLNGNGTGHNKCISLFLRIIKGKFDNLLRWPATFTMKFILINQEEKRNDSLIYGRDEQLFSFEKPTGDTDSGSDSWGLIEFVPHKMICTRNYIKDNTIKVRIVIRNKRYR